MGKSPFSVYKLSGEKMKNENLKIHCLCTGETKRICERARARKKNTPPPLIFGVEGGVFVSVRLEEFHPSIDGFFWFWW